MGKSASRRFYIITILLFTLVLLMCSITPVFAAGGKLFFTTIVEWDDSDNAQVILRWGPLEGEIPNEIVNFKLYKSTNGASHQFVAEIPNTLAAASSLNSHIGNDRAFRTKALVNALNQISLSKEDGQVDQSGSVKYLLGLLDPTSKGHDPLMAILLSRAHLSASVALGRAYIDNTVTTADSYQYLLTAVTTSGETLPIGQTDKVSPAIKTILPAPTGLSQVSLSDCSALGGGRDDKLINFTWDVPTAPQDLGLKVMTFGYDLFWSATDLGTVDFRAGIPAELYRVNQEPVVVAGPPPVTGPDSYLAKDGAENHSDGPAWKRGQRYFYYLVSKDIAGYYSLPASPVELVVADAMPPRAVWNAHSQEIKDAVDNITPRLALVWDAPTTTNFSRYYGGNRTICSAGEEEICWVSNNQSCSSDTPRCADLAVDHYRILRFDSPQAASAWGVDTDGDGWPDTIEKDPLVDTDSCNSSDHPAGNTVPWHPTQVPDAWIAKISPSDPLYHRNTTETHRQIAFIDYDISNNNKVYWYRIIAVDEQGNQSPLSAPLRGVLYDRSQPVPKAVMYNKNCTYSTDKTADCETQPEADDLLILKDTTGDAVSYKFFQQCRFLKTGMNLQLLDSGTLNNGLARIVNTKLPGLEKCTILPCGSASLGFVVRFYDADGEILAGTDPFTIESACTFNGCIILQENCDWDVIRTKDPYLIPDDTVRVCVDLETGQSARVYYQTPDGMSAFYSFATADVNNRFCQEFDDLGGLTPADICLGVRVFSENHVGSGMFYLGCLEMHAQNDQPPPAPLLEPVEPGQNETDKLLDLQWSMQAAGVGSYILKISTSENTTYESLWDVASDDSGRFLYSHPLQPIDVGQEFCFQLRALSTDMRASDWSLEQCGVWESGEPENLAWPPVAEPEDGGEIGAFFMQTSSEIQPVLVLSDNLTAEVDRLTGCREQVPICLPKTNEVACMGNAEFQYYNCPACSIVRAKIIADTFIVYRQESGHDFVQVSPLIEGFHCRTEDHGEVVDFLHDPFITLLDVTELVVKGVVDPVNIGAGIRILFKDRYPFKAGNPIRYKLVAINPETGEPEKVFTSNWVGP